ncbi:MAG: DUF1350 family protein [Leptolyngbyaceae cyanobacterium]
MNIRFRPLSFSWVAIHPEPKGVILFIGGAFFGTFPTIFYRFFLKSLFEENYTIVAIPFRFSFRHWPIAISLLREQEVLKTQICEAAKQLDYEYEIYQDRQNYTWIGHSLGCKYVTLLEFLSDKNWRQNLLNCVDGNEDQILDITRSLERIPAEHRSIKDEPSVLISPDISDTQSAIPKPLALLARFLDYIKLGVLPTRGQTKCFIEHSKLFNLTAIVSFKDDTIAGNKENTEEDVFWLIEHLKKRRFPLLHKELNGKHLEPIGVRLGNYIVDLNPFDKFIAPLHKRHLETVVVRFLNELQQRQSAVARKP